MGALNKQHIQSPPHTLQVISSTTASSALSIRLNLWLLPWLFLLTLLHSQQLCECRYLPTRSHGDNLDKLRELMLQILESSNELQSLNKHQQNEAVGKELAHPMLHNNPKYLNAIDTPRKLNLLEIMK